MYPNDMTFLSTKAETLSTLRTEGFNIPPLFYFSLNEWEKTRESILLQIASEFSRQSVAIRSSALSEDSTTTSMAGAFASVLHVAAEDTHAVERAVDHVADSLEAREDQIIVQKMVANVQMSGVVMTRSLTDGSPYYVINYDDASGRTDTVTGGHGQSKTVFIYHGFFYDYFDSQRLRAVLLLVKSIEEYYQGIPLDIEFAVDTDNIPHLLQVRRICTTQSWNTIAAVGVSNHIQHVASFVENAMTPRPGLFGKRTLFAVMPDWNPAEMIGIVPRPLAFSLYRALITQRVWSKARALMGYRDTPPNDLMVSIANRPYIDVRASFNSFIPKERGRELWPARLVEAWLDRLDAHPELHDKVEFAIVPTLLDFTFDATFRDRYGDILTPTEMQNYRKGLHSITQSALLPDSTLNTALDSIAKLRDLQNQLTHFQNEQNTHQSVTALAVELATLMQTCRKLGTLPFAIIARHAFMAEALLRSAVERGALKPERLVTFKSSIHTISGTFATEFKNVCEGTFPKDEFLNKYGHLRPSSYDILSPNYTQRAELFTNYNFPTLPDHSPPFTLSPTEQRSLEQLCYEHALAVSAENLLAYAAKAIAGREYAKFVFMRTVSDIIENIAAWGALHSLSRDDMSMLPVTIILDTLYATLPTDSQTFLQQRITEEKQQYNIAQSFKLSHIIRSTRDVYIVPQHRSEPNFITHKNIEGPSQYIDASSDGAHNLCGAIVCIESADPGYDWIFAHGIAGLVTCFGGANSHMAIRCAEFSIPAAIGCGGLLFEKVRYATHCRLHCGEKSIAPLVLQAQIV